MIQGTTQKYTFEVDIDAGEIMSVIISFSQDDTEVLYKKTEDCTINENLITVKLDQDDTFQFKANETLQVQIRILKHNREVVSTKQIAIDYVYNSTNKLVMK